MIRFGIVGCGWFGNFHIENLQEIVGTKVEALVSTNETKLLETGKKVPGASLYTNAADMFKNHDLDAIIIAVPPACHEDVELLATEYKVPFYVEKPIAVSLKQAEEIAAAVAKSGILTSVGYQGRYSPALTQIKEQIKNLRIPLAQGYWIGDRPSVHWWSKKELSGGQAVEQTTHIFDALRYLLGEAESVYARGVSHSSYDTEDASSALVTFRNGTVATILSGCYITPKGIGDTGLTLYGEDATYLRNWSADAQIKTSSNIETIPNIQNEHFLALSNFVKALQRNDPSLIRSDYADALKTFQLTMAVNQSLETGLPVSL